MSSLTGLLERVFPPRSRPYANPWPQPVEVNPWLDRSDALAAIKEKRLLGEIDAPTARNLAHWHRYGYLVLERVIDETRIRRVLDDFQRFDLERTVVGGLRMPMTPDEYGHFKTNINIHMQSDAVKNVFLDKTILKWLGLILGRPVYGCQTLNFFAGSRRRLHHDHVHMTTRPYGFLAASWIALEDAHPRSGPLVYVPGSQWTPYLDGHTLRTTTQPGKLIDDEVADRLEERLQGEGMRPKRFLARKGDVFLWHCNLVHGGAPVKDPRRSRKSMACHYAAFGVEYFHDLSGTVRDPSDVLDHNGAPYLPEYYDARGRFRPTKKEWIEAQEETQM